jgi:hypothetical protein
MSRLFSLLVIVGVIAMSACTVAVCPRTVKRCHTECYSVCCDSWGYCWDCDCRDVCDYECSGQPDGGK